MFDVFFWKIIIQTIYIKKFEKLYLKYVCMEHRFFLFS